MGKNNNDTGHYEGALLEEVNEHLKGIQEGQVSLAHMPKQLNDMDNRLKRVESDVKVIKAVVTGYSRDIKDLKARVTAKLKLTSI